MCLALVWGVIGDCTHDYLEHFFSAPASTGWFLGQVVWLAYFHTAHVPGYWSNRLNPSWTSAGAHCGALATPEACESPPQVFFHIHSLPSSSVSCALCEHAHAHALLSLELTLQMSSWSLPAAPQLPLQRIIFGNPPKHLARTSLCLRSKGVWTIECYLYFLPSSTYKKRLRTIILLLKPLPSGRIKSPSIYRSTNVVCETLGSLSSWELSRKLCTRFFVGIFRFWMHCHGKKWLLPQCNLAPPDSYRSVSKPLSIDTGVSVSSDDTGMRPDCGLTSSRLDKRKWSWRLFLFPYPFIFPCLFLSEPSRFLLFPTFLKCAIVSLVQSSNALPLCPIMCPIPQPVTPLSL